MKNKIIFYLLIFASLILILHIVNSKKIISDIDIRMDNIKSENFNLKDSIIKLKKVR